MSDTPEALLKSALEKIVYFEARSTQLSNDLGHTRAEVERLKADLGAAAQREIELRRVIAELEVRSTRAHAEREDSARVTEALRRERAELIGKMLEASRIQRSGQELEDFDLAQFIAELRSEVILKRENGQLVPVAVASSAASPSVAPQMSPGVTAVANELRAQGRLNVSAEQLAELGGAQSFPGRSEETLFGFSVRELSAVDVQARVRAAERLKALAHPAAAPALATALNCESEPAALVAFLGALSGLAHEEAVPVVQPHLTSPSPDVRIAALKALLVLDAAQAGPHLAAAMKDHDSAVRRRASLLALGLTGTAALSLGEQAIRDPVADVRSLAALVLGASGAESARGALLDAMRDPDLRVRRSASQAMSRLLGRDVTGLVSLDAAQRRREVRRLVNEPARPVQSFTPSARAIGSAMRAAATAAQAVAGSVTSRSGVAPAQASQSPVAQAFGTLAQAQLSQLVAASSPGVSMHAQPSQGAQGNRVAASSQQADVVSAQVSESQGMGAVGTSQQAEAGSASQGIRGAQQASVSAQVSASEGTRAARTSQQAEVVSASQGLRAEGASYDGRVVSAHAPAPRVGHSQLEHAAGTSSQAGIASTAAATSQPAATTQAPAAERTSAQPMRAATSPAAAATASLKSRVAVLEVEEVAEATPAVSPELLEGVMRELRASIRGRPVDELSTGINASGPQTLHALSALLAQGQVVRRGHKYFVA